MPKSMICVTSWRDGFRPALFYYNMPPDMRVHGTYNHVYTLPFGSHPVSIKLSRVNPFHHQLKPSTYGFLIHRK